MISYVTSVKMFLLGFILGCVFFALTRFAIVPCLRSLDHTILVSVWQHNDARWTHTSTTDQNLVLIGIMSAKQFLKSRVIPSFDTWVATVPGKVSSLFVLLTLLDSDFHPV